MESETVLSRIVLLLLFLGGLLGAVDVHSSRGVAPPPPTHEPVIIVPGILASYNKKLLFEDKSGGSWRFIPFGNVYKGLIKKFESYGYVQGIDLFVAYYDWREPNSESAAKYLIPVINQAKQGTGWNKVNIVAHSMGGLVSRSYIEGNDYQNDVDHLIMLGTPNLGSSFAYPVWEGGLPPQGWDLMSIVERRFISDMEISLKKVRNENLIRPASFRAFFPSLKELLPIQQYVMKDGSPVFPNQLAEQNTFLEELQTNEHLMADRGVQVKTIAGIDGTTLDEVDLTSNRTAEDVTLNRWRDGHPNPDPPQAHSAAGDGTVLTTSALLNNTDEETIASSHTGLPEKAQNQVAAALGLPDQSSDVYMLFHPPQKIIGVVVLSPVDVKITYPDGHEITNHDASDESVDIDDDPSDPDDPKIITIADPPDGHYGVELTGTDTGSYTVITNLSDSDEDHVTEYDGVTTPGETKELAFAVTEDSFIPPAGDTTVQEVSAPGDVGAEHHGPGDVGPDLLVTSKKPAAKKTGKVLGATIRISNCQLLTTWQPYFVTVFGRLPNKIEANFWSHRIKRGDKTTPKAVVGAFLSAKRRHVTYDPKLRLVPLAKGSAC